MSGRVDLRGGEVSQVGTVGTIESGVEVGTIVAVVDVGTIGFVGTLGTILAGISGTVVEERFSSRVSIWLNGSVVGVFASTIDMSLWDSVSVDVIAGTVLPSGSILVAVVGVEPLLGKLTSTIVASDWLVSNVSQRVTATDALGETLAVVGSVTGTVVGLTITAVRKS